MKKTLKNIIILIGCILISGCTKEVDFDQIDDMDISTSYILTLVQFNFTAENFIDPFGMEQLTHNENVELPLYNLSQKYLKKIEFTAITENTFNRNISIEIELFNVNGDKIYTIQPIIEVQANSGSTASVIEIPESDIGLVFYAHSFGFKIVMSASTDGSELTEYDNVTFNLKSSVKLYFNYQNV